MCSAWKGQRVNWQWGRAGGADRWFFPPVFLLAKLVVLLKTGLEIFCYMIHMDGITFDLKKWKCGNMFHFVWSVKGQACDE